MLAFLQCLNLFPSTKLEDLPWIAKHGVNNNHQKILIIIKCVLIIIKKGMTVLGQKNVDAWYGPETAYNIWQATKKFAGYYNPQGQLGGVGYTIVDGV